MSLPPLLDAPAPDDELRWTAAIAAWFERDTAPMEHALRDEQLSLTGEARSFLADLVAGKVSRGKGGRPPERPGWVERSIVAEVFALRDSMSDDAARALVAQRRGLTDDAVRGVVEKLRRAGITVERWRSWGRPDWKAR